MWGCCSCFSKTYEAPEVLELDYRHSSLTEVPPDVFTFERTLEKLDLGSNQISDLPPSLFHCHELKELDLCDNDLMCIPPAIGSLTRLWKLDLSRNAISDVADSIKNCKSLVYLDLSLNHLSKLPEGISQLVNLEELFLNDTYLEFLHANFGRLTKLKVVELRENSLQSLPKSMNRLHNLQRLDIGQNDILELPEVVGTMTNLTELWCDNNSMRSLPKFIGNLTKLNCVDVSQNDIQEITDDISKCTQLSDFSLNCNSLESLPDSFPKLEYLSVLRLDSNSIQYLPEDFGNLKSLQELSLVRNILKSVPASIGLLRKLHTLYLDDNLLIELPKEIGSCISLSVLSVCKNRLQEIASEIGHLSNLKVLSLSGNLIVHLPVSILNIPKLGALWLSESQSKPLLPLNKEIDPSTGQHVLTCYLLPQLPSSLEDNRQLVTEEKDEGIPPRRSRPSIKFVTDMDPPVVDNNVNKRGLLRAPTPYPKELRALAKHASHLRQAKDQNGDIVNTDEPEYEGDYNEEELVHTDATDGKTFGEVARKMSAPEAHNASQVNGSVHHFPPLPPLGSSYPPTQLPHPPPLLCTTEERQSERDGLGLPVSKPSQMVRVSQASYAHSYSSSSSASVVGGPPPHPPLPLDILLNDSSDATNKRGLDTVSTVEESRFPGIMFPEEKSGGYGNSGSELARKSPPPYHVAARRAAFFRSSGSSSPMPSQQQQLQQQQHQQPPTDLPSRMSPLILTKTPLYSSTDTEVGLPNIEPPHPPLPPTPILSIPGMPSNPPSSESLGAPNNAFLQMQSRLPNHPTKKQANDNCHSNANDLANNNSGALPVSSLSSRVGAEHNVEAGESVLNKTYIMSSRIEMESHRSSAEDVVAKCGDDRFQDTDTTSVVLRGNRVEEVGEYQQHAPPKGPAVEREHSCKENELKNNFLKSTLEEVSGVVDSLTTTRKVKAGLETKEISSLAALEGMDEGAIGRMEGESKTNTGSVVNAESFSSSCAPLGTTLREGDMVGVTLSSATSSMAPLLSTNFVAGLRGSGASGGLSYGSTRIASFNKNRPGIPVPGGAGASPVFSTTSTITTNKALHAVSPPPLASSESFSKIPKLGFHPQHSKTGNSGLHSGPSATNLSPEGGRGHGSREQTSLAPLSYSGSRIPKLPSFSNSSQPGTTANPNSQLPNLKKPEISAPKPNLLLDRATTPTKIPSAFGDSVKPKSESSIPRRGGLSDKVKNMNEPVIPSASNMAGSYGAANINTNINSFASVHLNQNTCETQMNNNNNSGISPVTRIPRFGEQSEKYEPRRSSGGAGSKIPKFGDSPTQIPPSQAAVSEVLESSPEISTSLNIPGGGSKIPTIAMASRKPWIFGTHKNARVVPVEYRKVNGLGFTVIDGATGTANFGTEGNGIYVDTIEGRDSTLKVGDKILQVDGIDVSNMGIEIVRKILSNCQESIHLLVSRHN